MIELLIDVNRRHGRTLVIVTHDPALAAFADETVALRDGRVVEHRVNGDGEAAGLKTGRSAETGTEAAGLKTGRSI